MYDWGLFSGGPRGSRHPPLMPKTLQTRHLASLTSVFVLIIPSSAFAFGVNPPQTGCFIRVDDPHISTSAIENYGTRAVKVNAHSVCNFAIRDLYITVEIYESSRFRNQKIANNTINKPGLILPNKKIFNKETTRTCKKTEIRSFYGVGYARTTINGRNYQTPHVRSKNIVRLRCSF